MAFDGNDNLFVATPYENIIYKFTPSGEKSVFASGLEHPIALAFDNDGNLFVAEDCVDGPDSIYKFNPDGSKTRFATGLNRPTALAFAPIPEPSFVGLVGVVVASLLVHARRRNCQCRSQPPF